MIHKCLKFDCTASFSVQIESHLVLLEMLPDGSRAHNHVRRVLNHVAGLGGSPAADGPPNNGHHPKSSTTATPSTSAAPVSTPTRALRDTASPSRSAGRGCGRPATASPSTGAPRARGWSGIASPSTSAPRGRGQPATTLQVVTTPSLSAPVLHAYPQFEVHPPIPDASPPMVDASPEPEVPSPTCSSAPTMPIDPPTSSSSDPLGPPVGIDTVQPAADVLDEHPPPQPSPPQGRP